MPQSRQPTPTRYEHLRALLLKHSLTFGHFTLASGEQSSVYLDVRKTALRADGASLIGELLYKDIQKYGGSALSAVGGMTLGADPLLTAISIASLSSQTPLHAIIVRKEAKAHGTQKQLEKGGGISPASSIVVVDDVVTSGGSTLLAIEALRKDGYHIEHAFCVVDRESGGAENLAKVGVKLHPLFLLSDLSQNQ